MSANSRYLVHEQIDGGIAVGFYEFVPPSPRWHTIERFNNFDSAAVRRDELNWGEEIPHPGTGEKMEPCYMYHPTVFGVPKNLSWPDYEAAEPEFQELRGEVLEVMERTAALNVGAVILDAVAEWLDGKLEDEAEDERAANSVRAYDDTIGERHLAEFEEAERLRGTNWRQIGEWEYYTLLAEGITTPPVLDAEVFYASGGMTELRKVQGWKGFMAASTEAAKEVARELQEIEYGGFIGANSKPI